MDLDLGDSVVIAMLGLLVLGLVWLATSIDAMRRDIEPLVNSPLVRTLQTIGA